MSIPSNAARKRRMQSSQSIFHFIGSILRDASRSLSSGAHSRDPLAMLLPSERGRAHPGMRSQTPHGEERGFARLEPRRHDTSTTHSRDPPTLLLPPHHPYPNPPPPLPPL